MTRTTKQTETKWTKQVCEGLRRRGALVHAMVAGRMQDSGLPDRTVVHRDWTGFLEFKGARTRLTRLQAHRLREVNRRTPLRGLVVRYAGEGGAESQVQDPDGVVLGTFDGTGEDLLDLLVMLDRHRLECYAVTHRALYDGVLVVGERMNTKRRAWTERRLEEALADSTRWDPSARSPARQAYGQAMRRLGAFHDARSVNTLARAGVDTELCASANLLPPAPGCGPEMWDHDLARLCARWVASWAPCVDTLVACGRRVSLALGASDHPGHEPGDTWTWHDKTVVEVPHPSGLCRYWNDASAVEVLRTKVLRALRAQKEETT